VGSDAARQPGRPTVGRLPSCGPASSAVTLAVSCSDPACEPRPTGCRRRRQGRDAGGQPGRSRRGLKASCSAGAGRRRCGAGRLDRCRRPLPGPRAPGRPAAVVPIIERAEGAYCGLPAPLLSAVLKVERGFDNTGINECAGALAMAQFLPASGERWKVNGKPDQDATIDPGTSLQVRRTYPTGDLGATRPLAGTG
jgi:hypothetical protein